MKIPDKIPAPGKCPHCGATVSTAGGTKIPDRIPAPGACPHCGKAPGAGSQ